MTRKEFEEVVKDALDELPKEFADKLQNVDVVIEDDVDMKDAKARGLGGKGRLLGLYQGVPLKDRTHYYGMVMPDKITLFKRNIERTCEARGLSVRDEVTHVIQHEIAHHFGISDKRLRDLGIY
jgi:predicted Zn-dependent protease with MMP-like domain